MHGQQRPGKRDPRLCCSESLEQRPPLTSSNASADSASSRRQPRELCCLLGRLVLHVPLRHRKTRDASLKVICSVCSICYMSATVVMLTAANHLLFCHATMLLLLLSYCTVVPDFGYGRCRVRPFHGNLAKSDLVKSLAI